MLLTFQIKRENKIIEQGWALNEVSIERKSTTMLELFVQIDNRPLSRWGCDGIICATPTGSTAYAFSAGGPVLWPEVQALVLLPIAAHALFAKPMVIAPSSTIGVAIESSDASLSADALRKIDLQKGDQIELTKNSEQVILAHLKSTVFTDRLVAKFKLPIEGWRGE
jgi:NAD+ kinase